ncbi:HAD family hydrolase [Erythrobacter sp. WG]|uniref:HAD family hydrolase n=1 Tax=Erythrobacter sp. WG TaxID=2985510 RepID=UPI0022721D9E|nr:HAD family hydrolase [Erythrobacter sp. WG]MCX9145731.1 HAD family hydrolase [Erythrobacter sp. WG]
MLFGNIIFDLDGTLIDSARLTGAIIDTMLRARGANVTADRELIREMDAIGGAAMIAAVMGRHSVDPAAEIEEFRAIHRTIAVPGDLAFPGVGDTLAALRRAGIGMAICSNKPQVLCEKILGDLDLAEHFGAIIGSAPDRPRKPSPETALMALEGIGGTAQDTLYCGDSAIDVATAKAAGLPVVLVAWGYGTGAAIAETPTVPVIAAMAELSDAIAGHGRSSLPGR